jgi:hypothetical protein
MPMSGNRLSAEQTTIVLIRTSARSITHKTLRPPPITLVVADPGRRLASSVATVHAVDVGATSADGVR